MSYKDYRERESRLDKQRRDSNRALRKDQKNICDTEIRRLRAARRAESKKVKQARKALEDLAPSEGNKYNGILKIGNLKGTAEARAVMAELDELEKLRHRSGMKAVFDHARGLVNGDNAGDITKRIGGLGVVSFMGLVSFVGLAESVLSRLGRANVWGGTIGMDGVQRHQPNYQEGSQERYLEVSS